MTDQQALSILAPDYVPVIYRRIIAAVSGEPQNVRALSHAIHSCGKNVSAALSFLRSKGIVRIATWKRGANRRSVAYWGLGSGPDAKPPRPLTNAERTARWRAKGNDSHQAHRLREQTARLPRMMSLIGQMEAVAK